MAEAQVEKLAKNLLLSGQGSPITSIISVQVIVCPEHGQQRADACLEILKANNVVNLLESRFTSFHSAQVQPCRQNLLNQVPQNSYVYNKSFWNQ